MSDPTSDQRHARAKREGGAIVYAKALAMLDDPRRIASERQGCTDTAARMLDQHGPFRPEWVENRKAYEFGKIAAMAIEDIARMVELGGVGDSLPDFPE